MNLTYYFLNIVIIIIIIITSFFLDYYVCNNFYVKHYELLLCIKCSKLINLPCIVRLF